MKNTTTAIVLLTTAMMTPLLTNAETVNFSSKGLSGSVNLPRDPDPCYELWYSAFQVFESLSKSQSDKTGSAGAVIDYYGDNVCTGEWVSAYDVVEGITFNKSGNGETFTASSSMPVYEYASDKTYQVDFNLTFTLISTWKNHYYGTNFYEDGVNRFKTHYDYNASSASVMGTISGSLPGLALDGEINGYGTINSNKSHDVSITNYTE